MENLGDDTATVLPLLCCCKNRNLKLADGSPAYEFLLNQLEKNVLFSLLPNSREESDDLDFLSEYMNNLDSSYGGYFSLRNVISELMNNVFDHSCGENYFVQKYLYSKFSNDSNRLDVCIIDDGLSIPGLFEKCGVDFHNDCYALEKAIGTFSTISNSLYERGNGLWTIIRLVAEGNGGEILIVSRFGCLHIMGEKYKYYLFDEKHMFKGTMVAVRWNKYEIQNIYDLIEFNKPDSYKISDIDDY